MKKIILLISLIAVIGLFVCEAGSKSLRSLYKDGVYEGNANGYGGSILVNVVIKNGRIRDIKIIKQNESVQNVNSVFEKLTGSLIVDQETSIDAVSGATITSKGFLAAVQNALDKASGKIKSEDTSIVEKASAGQSSKTKDANEKISIGTKPVQPLPVWVIGSYDKNGKADVMTAAWVGIACSSPPCVTVSLRKATYTYGNIMAKQAFTVNIPSAEYMKQTDFFGIVSGRDTDKFKDSGLTPVKSSLVNAPYVKEFPIVIECKLVKTVELGLHTMFIGEVQDIKVSSSLMKQNGSIDLAKLAPFLYSPSESAYYTISETDSGKAHSIGNELIKKNPKQ